MTSMKISQFSRPPTHLVQLRPKRTSPPSPNYNQSIKRKHNPRMAIACYQPFSYSEKMCWGQG